MCAQANRSLFEKIFPKENHMADLYLIYMIFSWDFTWRGIPEFPAKVVYGQRLGQRFTEKNRVKFWQRGIPECMHGSVLPPTSFVLYTL